MFKGIRSRPCPRNPWTPHAKEDWRKCWPEFKWSLTHPKETFAQAVHGAYGTNPDTTPDMRLAGFCFIGVGVLQMILGIVLIVASFVR